MDSQEALRQLRSQFRNKDWFADVGLDQYGRCVVYIRYMCAETLHDIPDNIGDCQVLVHFDLSKTATREHYVDMPDAIKFKVIPEFKYADGKPCAYDRAIDVSAAVLSEDQELLPLEDELDRLEAIVGTHTLETLFYEVHDGTNAITNLSARYPEVRKSLEALYEQYGFDVLYDSIDDMVSEEDDDHQASDR